MEHTFTSKVTQQMCIDSDVVILVRGSSFLMERISIELKKRDKLLIYVLDDDLMNFCNDLALSSYYSLEKVKARIRTIMSQCEILITPSKVIAHKYHGKFKKVVKIEEPALKPLNITKKKNEQIVIGFAGSFDRTDDIDTILSEVIRRLMVKFGDRIKIEFFGAKPKVVDELKLAYYSYENNYEKYKDKLGSVGWDIGLAPLADSEFNNCKYYNKYIEYAAAGIVGIYSKVEPYTDIIKDKQNGLLCDNTIYDWTEQITWLIEHQDEYKRLLVNVQNEIRYKFNIKKVSTDFLSEITELSSYKTKKCKRIWLRKIKLKSYLNKGLEFFLRNGAMGFILILKRLLKL